MASKVSIARFHNTLFRWHKTHYRDMDWRNTHDPYAILVSEVMLQQTQVERVRDSYRLFMRTFPTVKKLADAHLRDVLLVWKGLGYNRRAKYLHECARIVVSQYAGKFPKTREELVQLPGIGLSTSAALLAFAFDQDEPMIDTNIRRVLTRVFFHNQTQKDVQIYQFAKAMIPKGKGRAWNYAMLDIAATECCKRNHKASCVLTPFHGKVIDQQSEKSQKPFFQSQRYWRGKIVDYLRAHERVTESKLSKLFPECDSLEKVLESLLRDGMLKKNRTAYVLPE